VKKPLNKWIKMKRKRDADETERQDQIQARRETELAELE
jgi:hypothetical protein